MVSLSALRVGALVWVVFTVAGCPDDQGTGSGTTEPIDPSVCEGCLVGFAVEVRDSDMKNIVDQIAIAYTLDGVDSGKGAQELCDALSCSINETMGEIEVRVTFGACTQMETVEGWSSCGCSLRPAPWDPLVFTFDPACLDEAEPAG